MQPDDEAEKSKMDSYFVTAVVSRRLYVCAYLTTLPSIPINLLN